VTREQYIKERYDAHLHHWATLVFGVGALVILLLIPLDYAVIPAHFRSFLLCRFIAASIIFLIYRVNRKTIRRGLQSGSVVAAGAVATAMVAAMVHDFQGHESPYFAGFILTSIFVIGIIPAPFGVSALSGLVMHAIYVVPILAYDTITNAPYFVSANVLMFASISSLLLLRYLMGEQTDYEFGLEYERHVADEVLLARENQLAESQRIAHVGSWERDLSNDRAVWSDEMFCILGLNAKTDEAALGVFLEIVHPDDRDGLKKVLRQAVELREPFAVDCRLLLRSGEVKNIHAQGEVVLDAAGKPALLRGAVQDITERKRIELEREQLIADLQKVLAEIKTLRGILPICSCCKKIRDDRGAWTQMEAYLSKHTDVLFSHGLCLECEKKMYPDY